MLRVSKMFYFWSLAVCFTLHFLVYNTVVYGGEFLYISHNIYNRVNNSEAKAICKSYGTCELAVIDTQSENIRMYEYFNDMLGVDFILPTGVWVGLYWVDKGNRQYIHFWEESGELKQLTWSKWDVGEPNVPGIENCVRIHSNMYMRSIACSQRYDILCEGQGESSCLPFNTELVTEQSTDEFTENTLFGVTIDNTDTTEEKSRKQKHIISTKHWWTPLRIGLISGCITLFVFVMFCFLGWKCFYNKKLKVGCEKNETIYKIENNTNINCVFEYDENNKFETNDKLDSNCEKNEEIDVGVTSTYVNADMYEQDEKSEAVENKENDSYVYDENHVEHENDKTSNNVCELNEKENGNEIIEYCRYIHDKNDLHDDEEYYNKNGTDVKDEVDDDCGDDDDDIEEEEAEESWDIKNSNFDKTSGKPNPKIDDMQYVVPNKKYNSWMGLEEQALERTNSASGT